MLCAPFATISISATHQSPNRQAVCHHEQTKLWAWWPTCRKRMKQLWFIPHLCRSHLQHETYTILKNRSFRFVMFKIVTSHSQGIDFLKKVHMFSNDFFSVFWRINWTCPWYRRQTHHFQECRWTHHFEQRKETLWCLLNWRVTGDIMWEKITTFFKHFLNLSFSFITTFCSSVSVYLAPSHFVSTGWNRQRSGDGGE